MKWIIYLLLLLGVVLLPTEATDDGRLIPVEVVMVSEDRGIITMETDTGDIGRGRTIEEALDNMEETASGVIYLDTAEYLILEAGMEADLDALRHYLKGDVRMCRGHEGIPLEGIGEYLSVHKPKARLDDKGVVQIPLITEENGRYRLTEK